MRKIVTDGGTDQGLVLLVLEAAEEVRGYLKLQLHLLGLLLCGGVFSQEILR